MNKEESRWVYCDKCGAMVERGSQCGPCRRRQYLADVAATGWRPAEIPQHRFYRVFGAEVEDTCFDEKDAPREERLWLPPAFSEPPRLICWMDGRKRDDMTDTRYILLSERAKRAMATEFEDRHAFYPVEVHTPHGNGKLWALHILQSVEPDSSGLRPVPLREKGLSGNLVMPASRIPLGLFTLVGLPDLTGGRPPYPRADAAAPFCGPDFKRWWERHGFSGVSWGWNTHGNPGTPHNVCFEVDKRA